MAQALKSRMHRRLPARDEEMWSAVHADGAS
jgi:hypothetical protein